LEQAGSYPSAIPQATTAFFHENPFKKRLPMGVFAQTSSQFGDGRTGDVNNPIAEH
jgi:hypothetical protein